MFHCQDCFHNLGHGTGSFAVPEVRLDLYKGLARFVTRLYLRNSEASIQSGLTDPINKGSSFRPGEKTRPMADTSIGSPTGVPVPWASA